MQAVVGELLPDAPSFFSKLDGAPLTPAGFSNAARRLDLTVSQVSTWSEIAESLSASIVKKYGQACLSPSAVGTSCLDEFIDTFVARLWRRPVDETGRFRLKSLFTSLLEDGDRTQAMETVARAALLSWSMLFRSELGMEQNPSSPDRVVLDPFEIASSISLLISNGPPDRALLDAARDGSLLTPSVRLAHAERLLSKANTAHGLQQFFAELFRYEAVRFGSAKDQTLFPQFTQGLRDDLATESAMFFDDVLFGAQPQLDQVFIRRRTMLNPSLRQFYGLPSSSQVGFTAAALDDAPRFGFFTQASWLSRYAYAAESDVVGRGHFIWKLSRKGARPAHRHLGRVF
jgi:hypothetical protein